MLPWGDYPSHKIRLTESFDLFHDCLFLMMCCWNLFVHDTGGVICLVNSVNERDRCLLNSPPSDLHWVGLLRGTCIRLVAGR